MSISNIPAGKREEMAERRLRAFELRKGGASYRAIARALGSKPEILLYDEPTTGLDPITALTIDDEIIKLRDLEEVSSIIVTHQLRDAFYVATHEAERRGDEIDYVPATPAKAKEIAFVMLKDGHIHFEGGAEELRKSDDAYLRAFLS